MNPIPNENLTKLVEVASNELLNELREEGILGIKKLFVSIRVLTQEIERDERTLQKKKDSLAKKQADLEKIKNGDWSVLTLKDENSAIIPNANHSSL